MRIPYRWLREFVDTAADPRAVAERLTMAGIETGLVAEGASELGGPRRGRGARRGPARRQAATLRVCEVSTGAERYRVVCGAPNVRAGVRAAFAPPGAALPGGRRVAVATIRGTVVRGDALLGGGAGRRARTRAASCSWAPTRPWAPTWSATWVSTTRSSRSR